MARKPVPVAAPAAVTPPPPVFEIVLTRYNQTTAGQANDTREVVTFTQPYRERLYTHKGRTYEFVGMDGQARVYRDQTR